MISLVLLMAACHGPGSTDDTDSQPPVDTGDSDTDVAALPWTDIELTPPDLTVGVETDVAYQLVATSPDGVRGTPPNVVWTTSDHLVASADNGVAHTVHGGEVTITATWPGGTADAALHVDGNDALVAVVVDANTLLPIEGAGVQAGDDALEQTDVHGHTEKPGLPATPLTVCAWADGYVPMCAGRVVGRSLTLPLRPVPPAPTYAFGTVDLSSVNTSATPGALVIGIVGVSNPEDPRWTDMNQLLGPTRPVSIMSFTVDLPGNVAVKGADESFLAPGPAGARDIWGLATGVPLGDAIQIATGNADPLTVLGNNMGIAQHGAIDDFDLVEGTGLDVGQLAANAPLDASVTVSTGPLPDGSIGDEVPLLLGISDGPRGWLAVGLGSGQGSVALRSAGDAPADRIAGFVQAGGIGSGGGDAVVIAPVTSGSADLPPWPAIPSFPMYFPPNRLSVNADGAVVFLSGTDPTGAQLDLVVPGGGLAVDFPEIPPAFDRSSVTWDVRTAATSAGSYEDWLAHGPLVHATLEPVLVGTGHILGVVTPSR